MKNLTNRFSLIQKNKQCYVCGTTLNIHTHEVYFGKNRQKSIEDGCCVYLCAKHHNMSDKGIHFDKQLDLKVKKEMQIAWLEYYNKTIEEFIERYSRNYL